MLQDYKTRFWTGGGSLDLATSTTTEVTSDYIDFKAAGYADAGGELWVEFWIKSTTAAAGASFAFEILTCATSGGSYAIVGSKTVLLASCTAGAKIRVPVPSEMLRYMEVQVTPAASMTGALTVNAALVTS